MSDNLEYLRKKAIKFERAENCDSTDLDAKRRRPDTLSLVDNQTTAATTITAESNNTIRKRTGNKSKPFPQPPSLEEFPSIETDNAVMSSPPFRNSILSSSRINEDTSVTGIETRNCHCNCMESKLYIYIIACVVIRVLHFLGFLK